MMELVDLYDENRIPLGRTAERHAPKGPGEYRLVVHVLGDLRQSVTVNFDGGFDDFFIIQKDLDLSSLVLQKEEVAEVRYVTEEEAEAMAADGSFIPYPDGFLRFLFAMRDTFGFPTK